MKEQLTSSELSRDEASTPQDVKAKAATIAAALAAAAERMVPVAGTEPPVPQHPGVRDRPSQSPCSGSRADAKQKTHPAGNSQARAS